MVSNLFRLSISWQESSIPKGMKHEGYPWYDSTRDAPHSVLGYDWSWLDDWFKFNWQPKPAAGGSSWNWSDPGELIILGVAMLIISILIVLLIEFWRRYQPVAGSTGKTQPASLLSHRIEGLPADIRPTSSDPWIEAQRLRDRGDYTGALIALFAHQLLTLDRLRQIRLAPGRTGRQFVKSVHDSELKRATNSTLKLFEAAIYGHQPPSAQVFERLWIDALAFEHRAATELSQ